MKEVTKQKRLSNNDKEDFGGKSRASKNER